MVSLLEKSEIRILSEFAEKPHDPLIEAWENAPAEFLSYDPGSVYLQDGSSYAHLGGKRLIIKGEQVMDTCEFPWAQETVLAAFGSIRSDLRRVQTLELGLGLRVISNRIIDQFKARGAGEHTVIELNQDVYKEGLLWIERKKREFTDQGIEVPGSEPKIVINLRQGDATEWVEKLLQQEKKYDIIIWDTFPLKPEDTGINDLQKLAAVARLLRKDGVFSFFPHVPGAQSGSEGKMVAKQYELLDPYFEEIMLKKTQVNPPPEYTYLWGANEPIRILPVAICKGPKVNGKNFH